MRAVYRCADEARLSCFAGVHRVITAATRREEEIFSVYYVQRAFMQLQSSVPNCCDVISYDGELIQTGRIYIYTQQHSPRDLT